MSEAGTSKAYTTLCFLMRLAVCVVKLAVFIFIIIFDYYFLSKSPPEAPPAGWLRLLNALSGPSATALSKRLSQDSQRTLLREPDLIESADLARLS